MTDFDRAIAVLDEIKAFNEKAIADLRAILAESETGPLPTATVQTMTIGGWMQRPGSPRWMRIADIKECASTIDCWRIDFDTYPRDRDGTFVHVGAGDSFAFLTAEQFDRDCAQEQEDAALSRLAEAAIKSDGQEAA